jgi:hypothetical protein
MHIHKYDLDLILKHYAICTSQQYYLMDKHNKLLATKSVFQQEIFLENCEKAYAFCLQVNCQSSIIHASAVSCER